jgi:hypothetical protein
VISTFEKGHHLGLESIALYLVDFVSVDLVEMYQIRMVGLA